MNQGGSVISRICERSKASIKKHQSTGVFGVARCCAYRRSAAARNLDPVVLPGEPLGAVVPKVPASEYLLCLKFRDRLDTIRLRNGNGDLIAGMQRVER